MVRQVTHIGSPSARSFFSPQPTYVLIMLFFDFVKYNRITYCGSRIGKHLRNSTFWLQSGLCNLLCFNNGDCFSPCFLGIILCKLLWFIESNSAYPCCPYS